MISRHPMHGRDRHFCPRSVRLAFEHWVSRTRTLLQERRRRHAGPGTIDAVAAAAEPRIGSSGMPTAGEGTTADFDVAVLGAGAAGLVAAIRAAERGRRVVLLEKNRRPGVKILMSGGTRCNITQATDNRGIVEAYGPPGRFLHSALAALSVPDTIALFEAEGVPTKVEETGKVFPVSNRAADVLDALLRRLERSGARLRLEEPLRELARDEGGFRLTTSQGELRARRVILTTGGQSYPGSGTTGDGYRIAAGFGHRIVEPQPALV